MSKNTLPKFPKQKSHFDRKEKGLIGICLALVLVETHVLGCFYEVTGQMLKFRYGLRKNRS
jgi:hypothetical protein